MLDYFFAKTAVIFDTDLLSRYVILFRCYYGQ